ncbi:hypothetical protein KP800_20605 [Agrobacterium pusense]|nr:hypothetical protein [Ochrobactrum sp. AP1BH01-1]MCV0371242.1 hypothetical protein [Filomicrobium sp.]QQC28634.1 hypothetical protein I6H96_19020 [Brucella anthropi]QWW77439.1 hypothetical protein KP800_20605 [Agrobacterium pusense]
MVERTASPKATPICCEALKSADAMPVSCVCTPLTAVSASAITAPTKPKAVRKAAGMKCHI